MLNWVSMLAIDTASVQAPWPVRHRWMHTGDLATIDADRYCEGQIAHYKVPRYIRIVQDLPATVTGKPQNS